MAVIAAITFVVFTFPLAQRDAEVAQRTPSVIGLLKQCFPLFVALFMYNLIDNMPKFVMEGALSSTTSCTTTRCTSPRTPSC